jgi:hypothetical protein
LKPILKNKSSTLTIKEMASCGDDALIQNIVSETELDVGPHSRRLLPISQRPATALMQTTVAYCKKQEV